MKIRIRGNSIRIRLTKTEVDTLAASGIVEEVTQFPTGSFTYILRSTNGIEHLKAELDNNAIIMHIPNNVASTWNSNNIIGYDHKQVLPDGNILSLLVEKDFKCIDASGNEDQSDNYENPMQTC